jgi:hypothetical protein
MAHLSSQTTILHLGWLRFIAQEKGVNVTATWTSKEKAYKLGARALKFEGTKLSGVIVSQRLDIGRDSTKNHVVLVKKLEVEKGFVSFRCFIKGLEKGY